MREPPADGDAVDTGPPGGIDIRLVTHRYGLRRGELELLEHALNFLDLPKEEPVS